MRKFSGHTEFKDSLGYMRPYLGEKKVKKFNKKWLRPLVIIKIAFIFISALTAYVYMYPACAWSMQREEEGIGSPGPGGVCELPHG